MLRLPLLDCVPVVVVAAAVVFQLHLEGRTCWKDMLGMLLIEGVLTLLMMLFLLLVSWPDAKEPTLLSTSVILQSVVAS